MSKLEIVRLFLLNLERHGHIHDRDIFLMVSERAEFMGYKMLPNQSADQPMYFVKTREEVK